MKWFNPFGHQYLGDVLTEQKDEYNCGIGLVAAIGDVLGRSTASEITRYNKMFDHSSMHVEKSSTEEVEESPEEYACHFPRGTFQSLPTTSELGIITYCTRSRHSGSLCLIVMKSYKMMNCANAGIRIMLWIPLASVSRVILKIMQCKLLYLTLVQTCVSRSL